MLGTLLCSVIVKDVLRVPVFRLSLIADNTAAFIVDVTVTFAAHKLQVTMTRALSGPVIGGLS